MLSIIADDPSAGRGGLEITPTVSAEPERLPAYYRRGLKCLAKTN